MKASPPTAEELARWAEAAERVAREEAEAPAMDPDTDEDPRYYQMPAGFAHANGEWLD